MRKTIKFRIKSVIKVFALYKKNLLAHGLCSWGIAKASHANNIVIDIVGTNGTIDPLIQSGHHGFK